MAADDARERSLANLSPQNSLTHGARRWLSRSLAPPCDRCIGRDRCEDFEAGSTCKIAEAYRDSIVAEINALPHIQPTDAPLVAEYAQLATCLRIIDAYLGLAGPFLPGVESGYAEMQPVFTKNRLAVSNSLTRLASELGLSPMSRARIGKDPERGPASAIAAAIRAIANEKPGDRETPMDAEFTATDEEVVGNGA
ncbi:MAG: P27 family phage terminase small subunit [Verrucomicrobia bacterium]|nr:P27 family phage terminase small subunit [Verrucomicrobiota bacterium]